MDKLSEKEVKIIDGRVEAMRKSGKKLKKGQTWDGYKTELLYQRGQENEDIKLEMQGHRTIYENEHDYLVEVIREKNKLRKKVDTLGNIKVLAIYVLLIALIIGLGELVMYLTKVFQVNGN